ncbi:MAG: hypothetical protein CMO01_12890 [Thalassobius sp.]|nr:hypothetical protein [Thalassovita sp.]
MKIFKLISALLVFLFFFNVSNAQEAEIKANGEKMLQALNDGNAEKYMKYKHPSFSQYLPLSLELAGRPDTKVIQTQFDEGRDFDFTLSDHEVKVYGNCAVVTAMQEGTIHFEDGRIDTGKWMHTSVWVKENNEWLQVHMHVSKVQDEQPK